jgi:ketosteroid isomerase-like protein
MRRISARPWNTTPVTRPRRVGPVHEEKEKDMSDQENRSSGDANDSSWDAETRIREFLAISDPTDVSRRISFFAEGAVSELPFRPAPAPTRFEGLEAIRNQYTLGSKVYQTVSVKDVEVHMTTDPLVIFVYWTGENMLVNGYLYVNRFLGHFQFDNKGKLVLVREFYDPAKVVTLFKDNPDIYGDLWKNLPEGASR